MRKILEKVAIPTITLIVNNPPSRRGKIEVNSTDYHNIFSRNNPNPEDFLAREPMKDHKSIEFYAI